MFNTTLERLRCPARKKGRVVCGSLLTLVADRQAKADSGHGDPSVYDVLAGRLECKACHARYPILAGVAILVPDVPGFLRAHVKGVMQAVDAGELPREYARDLKEAYAALRTEHIEDDLEAER